MFHKFAVKNTKKNKAAEKFNGEFTTLPLCGTYSEDHENCSKNCVPASGGLMFKRDGMILYDIV